MAAVSLVAPSPVAPKSRTFSVSGAFEVEDACCAGATLHSAADTGPSIRKPRRASLFESMSEMLAQFRASLRYISSLPKQNQDGANDEHRFPHHQPRLGDDRPLLWNSPL